MMTRRFLQFITCVIVVVMEAPELFAGGGTSIVARPSEPARIAAHWPAGVADLVNDPARTTGWNPWFSEWPNDVQHYAFDVRTTDEVNRLIRELAAIKSDQRQIRLSHFKEPNSLGWVTRLPEGNGVAAVFSLGDQSRIDQWYKTVRKPFGVMEFFAAPVAVPPTLTIFVGNEAVKLADLEIPESVEVVHGYVPTIFHRWNTTIEQKREAEAAEQKAEEAHPQPDTKLDAPSQAAARQIEAFLKQRKERTGR